MTTETKPHIYVSQLGQKTLIALQDADQPLTIATLSRKVDSTHSYMVYLLRDLMYYGLIKQETNENKRIKLNRLTKNGEQLATYFTQVQNTIHNHIRRSQQKQQQKRKGTRKPKKQPKGTKK